MSELGIYGILMVLTAVVLLYMWALCFSISKFIDALGSGSIGDILCWLMVLLLYGGLGLIVIGVVFL